VGALVRLQFADGSRGPARLVAAGSGYRSQSSLVQVLGRGEHPAENVWVRWPDGREQVVGVKPGVVEVTVVYEEGV
ncbi:MAG TPA: ASPIC/UnbV domain-containing protein, partial [Rhodothermales bacterium]|nr:ASPIC/UnbV domain-containing protein [Rhodothermales bacterium]